MALPIKWVGSIHKRRGRGGFRPEAVVIHIMEGSLGGTDAWFNDSRAGVSAHYGIGKNGDIHQYVLETDTAFHAGRKSTPTWSLIKPGVNPNLYTIGIEHEGRGNSAWPDAMYESSAALIKEICTRWSIPIDRNHIIGHREIYGVKTCPNAVVDFNRLIRLARDGAMDPTTYNFVRKPGKVKTRTRLNTRKGAPTTTAPVGKTVAAGTELAYEGWTSNGESVSANAHWYRDADGNYFWAGGTEKPVPGA